MESDLELKSLSAKGVVKGSVDQVVHHPPIVNLKVDGTKYSVSIDQDVYVRLLKEALEAVD